ncbi:hypothetical protein ABL78_2836 [Leptomonas seymouri]|uniref:Uncharacterized protein n=1 Tax=Leptomonas seymouri TaxID=5684 RepID=A0A0N1I723_LEPSE|nr:hypothetical protein ABL78_2836 [Leptomonas seymouri]|eukprot:KPI88060.1 hypothetical protein ABL78_2836 [Leptomonas seymouri]
MRSNHRVSIIACCAVVLLLTLFIGTLLAFSHRCSKKSSARRARERELSAAQAATRAESRRQLGPVFPEAEAAPALLRYTGPALGNVVIKDVEEFVKLRDELVEVEVSTVCAAAAKTSDDMRTNGGREVDTSVSYAGHEPLEMFAERDQSPLSSPRHTLPGSHFIDSSDCSLEERGNHHVASSGNFLDDGGFVIVECSNGVQDASTRPSGTGDTVAANPDAAMATSPGKSPTPTAGPSIHLYRHQPSRHVYGESRYVSEVTKAPAAEL